MAVSAVNWGPTPAVNSLVDQSQWDRLAGLGDKYREGQKQSLLAQLSDDPVANKRLLLSSGFPDLAQLGLNYQQKDIDRLREDQRNVVLDRRADRAEGRADQAAANARGYLGIAQAGERRTQATYDENTVAGRTAKLVDAGLDPKDPNFAAHLATGAALPTPIQVEIEKRAKIKFDQEQKYATRESRLQAYREGVDAGELDPNDPEVKRWVALGGDVPDPAKNRLGIGAPLYTQNIETGEISAHQLSANKPFVTPPGHRLLGPGEVAEAKAKGTKVGAATGAATVALPKLVDNATHQARLLDEISKHPGRMWATGQFSNIPDWMLAGTPGAGFRSRFGQIGAQSFLSIYDQMRGAGQITNTEGDKGTSAVNRMSAATNEKDFDEAVKDLKEVLKTGVERAQRAAKGDYSLHPQELLALRDKLGVGAPAAAAPPGATRPPLGSIFGN